MSTNHNNITQFALKKRISFDFPVSMVPYLFYHVDKNLNFLMTHLKKRQKAAHKVNIELFCDHMETCYQIEIHPEAPHHNTESFLHLLETKLGQTPPQGLITEILIEVIPYDKNIHKNRYKKAYTYMSEQEAPTWIEEDVNRLKDKWRARLIQCI